jgi:prepilin-type N-terminal cleavage/methylation domain-containing protein
MRRQQGGRGFTLVELLVVLAIMAILAAVTAQGIARYGQHQQYVQFATEVQDAIAEARAKTIAGVGDTTYGVYVGTSTIEFFSGTIPVVGSAANTILEIPTYVNATSSLAGNVWYVSFVRLTGEPTATGTIVIGDRRGEATTTLTIYGSGLVQ